MRRMTILSVAAAVFALGAARQPQRGVVTGVTVAPNPAAAGATVTVSVTGTNPCGAVHINYGDGVALTYPIVDLPTRHTHAYGAGATYTIVAKGMGNCDGEVSTSIRIEGPPPPPPPPAQPTLASVSASPQPTRPNEPVTITLEGRGACTVALDFGDGNSQTVQGELPQRVRHNYVLAGDYAVAAAAQGPCSGTHRTTVRVTAPEQPGSLGSLVVSTPTAAPRQPVTITIQGTGTCSVMLDFGDGNTQMVQGPLPQRVSHAWSLERTYDIVATTYSPCTGVRTARIEIESAASPRVTGVLVTPNPTVANRRVTITVEGQGPCAVSVDFGDGNSQDLSGPLPLRVAHNYPLPGSYEILATAKAPCGGQRGTVLDVRR